MCRITIENEKLSLTVDQVGGSLVSVFDKERNKELLWQGNPEFWKFQDVVIFPLIGNPEGGYDVDGKTYSFRIAHGVARWEKYEIEEHSENRLVLRLESNEETLSRYPFHFRLRLIYELTDKKFTLTYAVSNTAGEHMPYQVGAHAGFNTEGKTVVVEFDKKAPVYHFPFDGKIHRPTKLLTEDGRIELSKEVFEKEPTLVLDKPAVNGCTVIREDGLKFHYEWSDVPDMALWGFANGGEFLCVEPWWGIGAGDDTPRELAEKENMYFADEEENLHFYSCEII